jgi:hypothetical protein
VAFDMFGWSWVMVTSFFGINTLVSTRGSVEQSVQKIKDHTVDAVITSWKIWPIFNLFNFGCVPVRFQVLAGNF